MEQSCAFCNPEIDQTLFGERHIGESENFHVVATKGQITDGGYVVLFPKRHVPCCATAENNPLDFAWLEYLSSRLRIGEGLVKEYSATALTIFEHGIVGQTVKHAHLHFLPAAIDMAPRIQTDFPESKIQEFKDFSELQESYIRRQEPYLFWTTPSGKGMICWNPPAPLQYLRIVAADLLGHPERANWRNMDPELDRRLYLETVQRLKPYFS
ncbi:MAG: hypothetical protein AAB897_02675 [Patescibacteria group bacterium]